MACASQERDGRGTRNLLESATVWRCSLLAAPKDAGTTPAARSPLAGGGVDGRRRGTAGASAGGGRLGDVSGESGPALGADSTNV